MSQDENPVQQNYQELVEKGFVSDSFIYRIFKEKFERDINGHYYLVYPLFRDVKYKKDGHILRLSYDLLRKTPIDKWDNLIEKKIQTQKKRNDTKLRKIRERQEQEEKIKKENEEKLDKLKDHLKMLPMDLHPYITSFLYHTKDTMKVLLLNTALTKLTKILTEKKRRITNIKDSRTPLQERKEILTDAILRHYKPEEYMYIIEIKDERYCR